MDQEYKIPKKGAVKRMREFYEKNRGKASEKLIEILKQSEIEKSKNKKSALGEAGSGAEL
jgi:hypothetical protein